MAEVIRAGTKTVTIRVREDKVSNDALRSLSDVLRQSKGECPVTLHLTLQDGAEATLGLSKDYRVAVGEPLLAGLEKVFGEQVAELR